MRLVLLIDREVYEIRVDYFCLVLQQGVFQQLQIIFNRHFLLILSALIKKTVILFLTTILLEFKLFKLKFLLVLVICL